MGSGSLGFALAWVPALAALDVGTLIQQPAVLLGAAAIVVVAVLIVLIMVLRGGSKKGELAQEVEDDQQPWESTPQAAVGQPGRGYDQHDQMLPWEQGGPRADGAYQQQAGGKRGAMARDPQAGWSQPEDYGERDAQWGGPAQAAPRGGQWGADQWAPAEAPSGRGGSDQRSPQAQMAPREQESWGWGGDQAAAGPQGRDEWGQGAGAAFPMGREADQWDQRKPPASPAMGRENDQWGQAPGGLAAPGRDVDQWGQGAASPAMGRENNQWGQPTPSSSMGWDNNQWGQGAASPAMGRENDQWGQDAPMRGRAQDQWGGQPAPAMGRGMDQPEDQGAGTRSGPRRGPDAGDQPDGQWKQGGWDQQGAAWEGNGGADRWNQGAQAPQAGRSSQPGVGSGGQGAMGGAPVQPQKGAEWGERSFDRPGQSAAQPGGSRGTREPPSWQADLRQEPPAWESPVQRSPSAPRPQWEQPGRAGAENAWESAGGAAEWGQPAQGPKSSTSRPMEPAGARGMSQPPAPAGDWGERDFERPTSRPGQPSGGWEQREAPPWQAPPEAAAPTRQPSGPQMAAPVGQVEAPVERRGPEARQIPRGSPDDTAYGPPASGDDSEGEVTKTVVMRKDAAPGRVPSVVVRQGKEPGRAYEMRKEQIRIGRSRESDIFLEDLAVSRLHATIYRDEMGVYQLRDENSANGTSVNGQRVSECTLQEGDEIQLGQTILAFVRR